jgi:hypothetical protein
VVHNHGVAAARDPEIVIEVGEVRPHVVRAVRIFCETVLVPTLLLYAVMHLVGLVTALSAVLGWCALTLIVRWLAGHQMPGTLLLCVGLLVGRTSLALALSSAVVYLLQPVFGSILMAALFLGSAAIGRPVTARLARDFITLPAHLFHHWGVRRMFSQVAMVWGRSRLVDAGMSLGLLHLGLDAGLLSRGVLSGVLTALTVTACVFWGWRSLRRLPGITLRWRLRGSPA